MAKQLEPSIESTTVSGSELVWFVLSVTVVVILLAVLIIGASDGRWMVSGLALAGLIISAAIAIRSGSRFWSPSRGTSALDWKTAGSDIQKQNLNIEVAHLGRVLDIPGEQIGDLQSAYIVAEDLALRQIQQDEESPVFRHITLGKTSFDGLLVKNDVLCLIEVAFLVLPDIRQERVEAMLRKARQAKTMLAERGSRAKIRLMLVLVTQLTPEDDDKLRSELSRKKFEETPVDIDIRLLDFESLQKIYVTE